MEGEKEDLEERIATFRSSVSTNLLAQDDFIDWNEIDRELKRAQNSVDQLQHFVDHNEITANALAELLQEQPGVYKILSSLIAFNTTGAQVTKWGLPPSVPREPRQIHWLSEQLFYIGIDKLLKGGSIISLLRVAEVYKDSIRRRFRSGKTLESRVNNIVRDAIGKANSNIDTSLRISSSVLADPQLRRALDFVIAADSRPVAGIATVFQNQSGGRQQRDLAQTYPILQERLAGHGVGLILIADGQGLREASERTLTALFSDVRYPMTLRQAQDGLLEESIIAATVVPAITTLDQAALNRIIASTLNSRMKVSPEELPVPERDAVLALARFDETRRDLNLTLSPGGKELSWKNPDAVSDAQKLVESFSPNSALKLFASLIGGDIPGPLNLIGDVQATLSIPESPPFTGQLHVIATNGSRNADLAREVGVRSLDEAPGSAVAIVLTPSELEDHELELHRKRQAVRPVNLVQVSPSMLLQMAKRKSPLATLVDAVLTQSDLTKVSPFILSNATPTRMFYGRDSEAATILNTISTNSVAILGSRRIGKTSLIRRVQEELKASKFLPYFGDCQTVKTWQDFSELAKLEWGVDTPKVFEPRHLADLVAQLDADGNQQVVLLLDEIDQLLEWDRRHSEDSVPEAFFRACRSISQDGAAQFVFSGERTIANRIWDPQSPHWNFCRPLPLSQLSREAATSLLVRPLRAMNIAIDDEEAFAQKAWERTSGHPQIVQYLGDRLVRVLDEYTDRTVLVLKSEQIDEIANTYDFAEHYISTYWGQSTRIEKLIGLLTANSPKSAAGLAKTLKGFGVAQRSADLMSALRMLQLYGILEEKDQGFILRAQWFPAALEHFGGLQAEIDRLLAEKES